MKNKISTAKLITNILIAVFAGVLIFASVQLAVIFTGRKKAGNLKDTTHSMYNNAATGQAEDLDKLYNDLKNPKNQKDQLAHNKQRFAEFFEMNHDFTGYISIPGTEISYPVVQAENNDYYLTHDFKKEYYSGGAIFMDSRNQLAPQDKHIILYGHNMKDNSMFGPLSKYTDQKYLEQAKYIYLDTLHGMTKWEIFSAYTTSTEFYYIQTQFDTEQDYSEFLKDISAKSEIDTGISPSKEDYILTLSTCDYSFNNARFAVHARLVD